MWKRKKPIFILSLILAAILCLNSCATANYDNFASIEVIMKNGGVEDEPNGDILRFWIDLNETEEAKNDDLG